MCDPGDEILEFNKKNNLDEIKERMERIKDRFIKPKEKSVNEMVEERMLRRKRRFDGRSK
jgi:hypothetical protein